MVLMKWVMECLTSWLIDEGLVIEGKLDKRALNGVVGASICQTGLRGVSWQLTPLR